MHILCLDARQSNRQNSLKMILKKYIVLVNVAREKKISLITNNILLFI